MLQSHRSPISRAMLALRLGFGFIWIYEGLVPKLLVPITGFERDVVMASGLIPNGSEDALIHLLGVLEIMLGVLILAGVWLRPLCLVQAAIVGFFTLVIPLTHPPTLPIRSVSCPRTCRFSA